MPQSQTLSPSVPNRPLWSAHDPTLAQHLPIPSLSLPGFPSSTSPSRNATPPRECTISPPSLLTLGRQKFLQILLHICPAEARALLSPLTAQVVIRAISSRTRGQAAYLQEESFCCNWEAVSRIQNVQCVSS
ncbi:hypothetical protein BGX38DRAFT_110236 [Terfezia claveryi]|nr:hypothetical protein BGX38DRAFT_774723 [Terfezia claveryi]KAF8455855.1 hypothetical protein BGX38DRAFT_110236 [Terfezia claveryi]